MALTGANSMTSSDAFASSGGFIVLAILKKGTLDPNQPLIGGANGIEYFEYNIGNPDFQIYYTDQQGNSTPLAITAGYTTIPSVISATFAPGGDFDWALLLGASGQEAPGENFDIDLSHTLTLDYVAPEGTQTTSASGQFANIAAAAALGSGTAHHFHFCGRTCRFGHDAPPQESRACSRQPLSGLSMAFANC